MQLRELADGAWERMKLGGSIHGVSEMSWVCSGCGASCAFSVPLGCRSDTAPASWSGFRSSKEVPGYCCRSTTICPFGRNTKVCAVLEMLVFVLKHNNEHYRSHKVSAPISGGTIEILFLNRYSTRTFVNAAQTFPGSMAICKRGYEVGSTHSVLSCMGCAPCYSPHSAAAAPCSSSKLPVC